MGITFGCWGTIGGEKLKKIIKFLKQLLKIYDNESIIIKVADCREEMRDMVKLTDKMDYKKNKISKESIHNNRRKNFATERAIGQIALKYGMREISSIKIMGEEEVVQAENTCYTFMLSTGDKEDKVEICLRT